MIDVQENRYERRSSTKDTLKPFSGGTIMNARCLSSLAKTSLTSGVACGIAALLLVCTTLPVFAASSMTANDVMNSLPFYGFLTDPNTVFLLFIVALIGLYLEISHPGTIVPGVAGAIALVLFLLGAGALSPNWGGFTLMALAFVLLVLDMKLPAHGILTAGAVASLITGSLLFFNGGSPVNGQGIDPLVVYVMSGIVGSFGLLIAVYVARARHLPVNNGMEGLIGAKVTALTPLMPEGRVRYGGEDWAAILDPPTVAVNRDTLLMVTAIDGLRLHVRPVILELSGAEAQQIPPYMRGPNPRI
jgi:membrane-bound ClpP family serine protease